MHARKARSSPRPAVDNGENLALLGVQRIPANQVEGPPPAGLGEEVRGEVDQVIDANISAFEVLCGRVKRPVNQERSSIDAVTRHQSDEAAVVRVFAVVTHGKDET